MLKGATRFGKSKIFLFIFFCAIILPIIIPLFTSYVPGTADGMAHKFRVVSFGRSISEGNLRPRWLGDQALGYGSPIFLFNYIFPYYLVDGLTRMGFGINKATQVFETITLIFSFLAMYLLGSKLWGRKAGIVAATAYTWAPYHLLSIYLYEGWGEMTAFVFPPLIIYSIIKDQDIRKSNKTNLTTHFSLLTTFTWSLFIMSHNVSALLYTPVIMLLALLTVRFKLNDWLKVGLMPYILSLILTAFFWLPAVSLHNLINYPDLIAAEMGLRGSYFKSLQTIVGVAFSTIFKSQTNYYDYTLGLPILAGAIIGLVITVILFWKIRYHVLKHSNIEFGTMRIAVLLAVFFLSIYLANYASNWVWESISALRFIVYPFRFLALATFAGSLVVAYLSRKKLIVAIVFIILSILSGRAYTKPYVDIFPFEDNYFQQPQTVFYAPETKKNMATTEFLPQWVSNKTLTEIEQAYFDSKKLPDKFSLPINTGKISKAEIKQEKMSALVDITHDNTTVTVAAFYFPNWRAKIDGVDIPLGKDISGRITLPVTQGRHNLELYFGKSNAERLGDIISIFGLLIILFIFIYPGLRG